MAESKSTTKSGKARESGRGSVSGASKKKARRAEPAKDPGVWLRLRTDARSERRYEPKTAPAAIITVLCMSIGAVLVGAGTYGQWLRAEGLGPHKYAVHMLAGGAAILIGVALFGYRMPKPIRVGDAGVALERDASDFDRIGWYEVTRVLLGGDVLTIQASGRSISIPIATHADAASRALAEAQDRIPARIDEGTKLPAPDDSAGEALGLEAPQIAGARCKKSDKAISFEKDARLCGKCGEVYHKDTVPKRCVTCDAKLVA